MRTSSPSGHPSSLHARGRRVALVVLATAVLVAGCSRGGGVDDTSSDLEPGQPIDVTGRPGLAFHDLSPKDTLLFPDRILDDFVVEGDEEAIRAVAASVGAWLDTVLSERNRGLTTTLAASDVDVAALATALGIDGPATDGVLDTQVSDALYLIEVAYLGEPGWALARVESLLVPADDPTALPVRRLDTFVFAIDASGAVELLALEVAL